MNFLFKAVPVPGDNIIICLYESIERCELLLQVEWQPDLSLSIDYGMIMVWYTCIFCHFYGKSSATSWRYVHVNVMSHININKFKMVEQRLCS